MILIMKSRMRKGGSAAKMLCASIFIHSLRRQKLLEADEALLVCRRVIGSLTYSGRQCTYVFVLFLGFLALSDCASLKRSAATARGGIS